MDRRSLPALKLHQSSARDPGLIGQCLLRNVREGAPAGECSAAVRTRVIAARERQWVRGALNAHLDSKALRACASLVEADQGLLEQAIERLQLSARAMHRILRVARTIADLAGCADIGTEHLAEAIGYRQLDRGSGV